MRLLIYAFKPYGGYPDNASERVLARLTAGDEVAREVFEVRFDPRMFQEVMARVRPDAILGLGQHPRARKLRIERKAVNLRAEPGAASAPIRPGGPAARYANLLLPASSLTTTTYDAGTYVCNYSMYLMGEYCEQHRARFGFLHVPRALSTDAVCAYLKDAVGGMRG